MRRIYVAVCCLCLTTTVTAEDDGQFVLESVEKKFTSDIAKAQNDVSRAEAELAKAKKTAAAARLKAYRDRLVEVTKSGDFDKALAVKARIEALEKDSEVDSPIGKKPSRIPKEATKFGGHSYALIKEPATWHVAKRRCEEMGGHLLVIDSLPESQFALRLADGATAWVGTTDEETEGKWVWVTGRDNGYFPPHQINGDDGHSHFLAAYRNEWHDFTVGQRQAYLCEWDR